MRPQLPAAAQACPTQGLQALQEAPVLPASLTVACTPWPLTRQGGTQSSLISWISLPHPAFLIPAITLRGKKKNASCRFLAGRSQRLSCVTHLAAKPARLTCGAAPLPALWGEKQRKARSLPNTSCVAPRAALSARANSRRCSDRGHRGRLDAGSSAAAAVEARGRSTQPAASARADQITLVPYPRALAQLSPLQPIRIPNSPQLQTLKFSQRALLFLARANVSNADVRSPRLSSQLRIPLIPCKEAERKAVTYRL